jgi:hypothetical protein
MKKFFFLKIWTYHDRALNFPHRNFATDDFWPQAHLNNTTHINSTGVLGCLGGWVVGLSNKPTTQTTQNPC